MASSGGPSPEGQGLVSGVLPLTRLDIHEEIVPVDIDMEMQRAGKDCRTRSDEDSDEGYIKVKKRAKNRSLRVGLDGETELGLPTATGKIVDNHTMVTAPDSDGTKVVIIRFLEKEKNITDPRMLTKLLNESPLQKYVVQCSVKNLGSSGNYRLKIRDENNSMEPLENIQQLGSGLKVRCWYASSDQTSAFGKIGPISTNVSNKYLLETLEPLNGSNAVITSVKRLRNRNGDPTETVIIGTQGDLPGEVAANNVAYPVSVYIRDPLRCFKCHFFGHGTLTCRFYKNRCFRCGDFHDDLEKCNTDYFCIFCKGSHRYTSKECEVNQKARNLEYKKSKKLISDEEAKEGYRALNKLAYSSALGYTSNSKVRQSDALGDLTSVKSKTITDHQKSTDNRPTNDNSKYVLNNSFSDMESTEGTYRDALISGSKYRHRYHYKKPTSIPNKPRVNQECLRVPNLPNFANDPFSYKSSLISSDIYRA